MIFVVILRMDLLNDFLTSQEDIIYLKGEDSGNYIFIIEKD